MVYEKQFSDSLHIKSFSKKIKFFSKEKKKIQHFDSWVAVINPFHIPTHKKLYIKKRRSNTFLCLSPYTLLYPFLSLSLSSEMYFLCTILKQFLSIWLKTSEKWLLFLITPANNLIIIFFFLNLFLPGLY